MRRMAEKDAPRQGAEDERSIGVLWMPPPPPAVGVAVRGGDAKLRRWCGPDMHGADG